MQTTSKILNLGSSLSLQMLKLTFSKLTLVNGFQQADAALRGTLKGMGYLGTWGNFNIFVSNNVAHSNLVTVSSLAANDTLTINGATITFKAAPAAAGECKPTAAALIGMINGVMGTAGDYVEFDAADRAKLLSVNAPFAIANGSDVEMLQLDQLLTQSGVTLGGEVLTVGLDNMDVLIWLSKKMLQFRRTKNQKDWLQLSLLDFVRN